ncbi:MAG: YifB family Mg chelatase-like AAA ATPase [Acidimicrobiia bacterium]|nr:YifB family Mg chelatase-like AAA ATPase [Acidimicrobiia bacterium]
MLAAVSSAVLTGVEGHPVTVEVHVGTGLPSFAIVGLPDASCRESRDRVRAAVTSCRVQWPSRRITVNLAPSGLRKAGAGLDLAIAVGILAAAEEIPAGSWRDTGFLGELGLDGSVRPVAGTLCLVDAVDQPAVVVADRVASEAALLGRHRVRSVPHLAALVAALRGDGPWPDPPVDRRADPVSIPMPDLAEVRGHELGRRALEVSAAGGHHLLMVGPPGAGKTLLAERLGGLLPDLHPSEALEVTRIHSAAAERDSFAGLVRRPPTRAPHHSASQVALIGGGSQHLRPGEVSLAHRGVLFLDELGEFPATVLDALRTPLEDGVVRIARAELRTTLPARFLLVGAMNPCPCGAAGGPGSCRCSPAQLARYGRRLSGPFLDRFDVRIQLLPPDPALLVDGAPGEATASVAARVAQARARSADRGVEANAALDAPGVDRHAPLDHAAARLAEGALRSGRLSARGYRRVRCVALTLADLDGVDPPIGVEHLAEALVLRTAGVAGDRSAA